METALQNELQLPVNRQTIAQETGAALPNFIWFLFYFQAQGHTASPRSFTELRMLLHYSEEGTDSELTVCRHMSQMGTVPLSTSQQTDQFSTSVAPSCNIKNFHGHLIVSVPHSDSDVASFDFGITFKLFYLYFIFEFVKSPAVTQKASTLQPRFQS